MNIANTAELLARITDGLNPKYLYFWGHTPAQKDEVDKSCLSQWFAAPFVLNHITYITAEHYMMAQKALLFGDSEVHKKIVTAAHPGEAKRLGREVRGFDPIQWESEREHIVFNGSLAKFSQNERLKTFLLSTGERVLVEASPVDKIWGGLTASDPRILSPANWEGFNLLGFALMKARRELQKQDLLPQDRA